MSFLGQELTNVARQKPRSPQGADANGSGFVTRYTRRTTTSWMSPTRRRKQLTRLPSKVAFRSPVRSELKKAFRANFRARFLRSSTISFKRVNKAPKIRRTVRYWGPSEFPPRAGPVECIAFISSKRVKLTRVGEIGKATVLREHKRTSPRGIETTMCASKYFDHEKKLEQWICAGKKIAGILRFIFLGECQLRPPRIVVS